ncbi:hypothetical protein O6P43_012417 [Quillaja saponaria]|uniref:Uncharacterized protein n=1 Tax=Quillaja saponaria TaxID=32244 RepID=A0AAD7PU38_QUISA|nr:hypothetical protein O6P43_012417 [Quillaja saponaria]
MIDDQDLGFFANFLGVVGIAGGEKKGSVGTEGKSGLVVIGGGNLNSGKMGVVRKAGSGGRGGNVKPGKLGKLPDVGARSFLEAWAVSMLEIDKAMKKTKARKRVEAITL